MLRTTGAGSSAAGLGALSAKPSCRRARWRPCSKGPAMNSRRRELLALGVVLLGWALGGEWVSIRQHVQENHLIDALGGLSFLAAGLVALDRRPHNRIGWLMIAFGSSWYLGNWGNLQAAVVPMIGLIGQQLGAPILAQMVLAYPTGRLRTRFE